MNQLTESELQALERMEPHDFHRVLMQIVASGMTAWRNESAGQVRPKMHRHREPSLVRSAPIAQESAEMAEAFV